MVDTGPLIALDGSGYRDVVRYMRGLVREGALLITSSGVLAQAYRSSKQVRLHQAIKLLEHIHPISDWRSIGLILADSGTSDVVDAHVAALALHYNAVIWTSDPDDMVKLGVANVVRQ